MAKKKQEDIKNQKKDEKEKVAEKTAEKKEESKEEKLQKELDEKTNQMLSLAAEYDNFRKRTAKEKETIYADAKISVLKEFLSVADNLERAIAGDESDAAAYKKGVEMTHSQLLGIFTKLGVEEYGDVDDDFDPQFYNAVMHIEDENFGDQKVAEVFQKGYRHGDKVIRAAMVKVAN